MSTAQSPTDSAPPLEIADLTRRFGSNTALDSISLKVPKGCVFGLLGENGAGKTTLIKHAMGLLNAQSGSVRVFGINPVQDPEGALARVGYLSEDRDIPRWMRVEELMRYMQGFYPKWDNAFAQELLMGSATWKTRAPGTEAWATRGNARAFATPGSAVSGLARGALVIAASP